MIKDMTKPELAEQLESAQRMLADVQSIGGAMRGAESILNDVYQQMPHHRVAEKATVATLLATSRAMAIRIDTALADLPF